MAIPTVTIPTGYADKLFAGQTTDVHAGIEVQNSPAPGSNPYTSTGFNPLPTNDARLNAEAFRIATQRYAEMTEEQQKGTNISFLAIEIANELSQQQQPVPDVIVPRPAAAPPVQPIKQADTMQPGPIQFTGGQPSVPVPAAADISASVQRVLDTLEMPGLSEQPAAPAILLVIQLQGAGQADRIALPAHWARVVQDKQTGVAEMISVTVDTRINPALLDSVTIPSDTTSSATLTLYVLDAEGNVDNTATQLTYTVAHGVIPTILGVFYTLTFFVYAGLDTAK